MVCWRGVVRFRGFGWARRDKCSAVESKSARPDLSVSRQKTIESTKKTNASAEADFMETRDNALKAGMAGKESWEKVTSYLDLTADPKRNNLVSAPPPLPASIPPDPL